MVASNWPRLTIWPSLNSTWVITPFTCGRTRTVAWGTTVPSASRLTGMSAASAVATPTVTALRPPPPGPPPPPAPPRAAPPAPPPAPRWAAAARPRVGAAAPGPPPPAGAASGRAAGATARPALGRGRLLFRAGEVPRQPGEAGGHHEGDHGADQGSAATEFASRRHGGGLGRHGRGGLRRRRGGGDRCPSCFVCDGQVQQALRGPPAGSTTRQCPTRMAVGVFLLFARRGG